MPVVAEFSLPAEAVPGGRTLTELPESTVQLERIVPAVDQVFPFFWVFDSDPQAFLATLQTEPEIADVGILTEVYRGALFEATWTADAEVINGIKALKATIIEATGRADGWVFQIRAVDRVGLNEFQRIFTDQGIPVEVQRVYNFAESVDRTRPVTPDQREMLLAAFDRGYYEQPRQVTQRELGEAFDISGRAVSNRLRRGTRNLISGALLEPGDLE